MLKLIRFIKYYIYVLVIGRFFGPIRASNLLASTQPSNESQHSTESDSAEEPDPFKTTFEGNDVNLDINCLHGYSKFNCTIAYTEVTYQSTNIFKSALDGETEIWKAENDKAFRLKSQLLDRKPISLTVDFDRSDNSSAKYFRRKHNSSDWEEIDKQTHDQFVEKFKKALNDYKESVKNDCKEAVDLDLKIKNTTEIEFDFHTYNSKEEKVSEGTEAAKAANQKITEDKYTVKTTEEVDGSGVSKKIMEVELTDKKFRITKVNVRSKVAISCKVWETGGTAFCTKMVARWEIDSLKEIVLTLTYKDSGKNTELVLKANASWQFLYDFKEITEKDLPTFDFQY